MIAKRIVIGLVGQPSGGKDTVAEYLIQKYGFEHVPGGDLVRAYIAEHKLGEPTRPLMNKVATSLRTENGADYLARLALQNKAQKLIISGLRNSAEAKTLKQAGGQIVDVKASLQARYQRALKRGRPGDKLSFAEFKQQQIVEEASVNANSHDILAVIALADYTINNDGSLNDLYQRVDDLLAKIL